MTPIELAKLVADTEKKIETLATKRPLILTEMIQADAEKDVNSATKQRNALSVLDVEIEMARQQKNSLESALQKAIGDEIDREVQELPETRRLMRNEIEGAAEEMGALVGRILYLEQHYLPGASYVKWMNEKSIYGNPKEIPHEVSTVFRIISSSKNKTTEALQGTDPVAESYAERYRAFRDAEEMQRDAGMRTYKIKKRWAVATQAAKESK